MEFEYDPQKSARNLAKHGIDFGEAQRLWDDRTVAIPSLADCGEARFVVLGMIDGKHWSAVVTYRGERVRIISVRRSRTKEARCYDSKELEP